jgi:endoglucanase
LQARVHMPKMRRRPGFVGALRLAVSASVITVSVGLGLAGRIEAAWSAVVVDNPLGLRVAPTNGNPLSGARFFVDPESAASWAARLYPQLRVIAEQPGAARFGTFTGPDVGSAVHDYLVRASQEEPGTVPMLATYQLVDGHCGNWTPTPADQDVYHSFITRFAQGVGSHRAVLFLEMDSLITTPCLSPQGVAIRMSELSDAINVLTANCPHLVIYLDAGAADALPAARTAKLLRWAGVARIQGFFLNSTHFDWTSKEIRYGEEVSQLTGGKHFVVNTGENGQGPLVPQDRVHQGNEVLCNPPGRGLGPKPTTDTGYPNVDAFAWTSNPGESGGACVPGAPPTGAYWPAYALMLVQNANFTADSHFSVSPARATRRDPKRRARGAGGRLAHRHNARRRSSG